MKPAGVAGTSEGGAERGAPGKCMMPFGVKVGAGAEGGGGIIIVRETGAWYCGAATTVVVVVGAVLGGEALTTVGAGVESLVAVK